MSADKFHDQLVKTLRVLRGLRRPRPVPRVARCALCGGAVAGSGQVCARCDAQAQRRAAVGKRRGGKPRVTRVAPWMPGYEEYAERQRAAKAKAKDTREQKKAAAQAARDAEQREEFAATLRSEQRIAAMGQGHSSTFMPPGGYRAVPAPDSMLRLFPDGRWFGIFPVDGVVGPFRTRTELERAAAQHAFDRGQGRGPHGETENVGGQWVGGGERRGGKLRHTPQDLARGARHELEHAQTLKKVATGKLTVKQAVRETARTHLKKDPAYYDRLDIVELPKRGKKLKPPRLKLLYHYGKLRVYLVDSNAVRKLYGDWTMGGHHRVYADFIPPNEVWIAEEVVGLERRLTTLHELLEYRRMGAGMSYDEAHDLSTAAEQEFRKGKRPRRELDAAIREALKRAAVS